MPIRRVVQKAKGFLRQGLQPRELAASVTIAVLIGIFPIYGTTTAILVLLAVRMRLNLPLMLFISYLLTPLQLLLVIPFMRVGEWLFGVPYLEIDLTTLQTAFNTNVWDTVSTFSGRILLSIAGWVVLIGPMAFALFILLFQIFKAVHRRKIAQKAVE